MCDAAVHELQKDMLLSQFINRDDIRSLAILRYRLEKAETTRPPRVAYP